MNRTPVKKRRTRPRRGRVTDKKRLEWAATIPCQITGEFPATTHHVREYGSPKDDTKIIRLVARLHMKTHALPHLPCIEDGKAQFERVYECNLNDMIGELRRMYEQVR